MNILIYIKSIASFLIVMIAFYGGIKMLFFNKKKETKLKSTFSKILNKSIAIGMLLIGVIGLILYIYAFSQVGFEIIFPSAENIEKIFNK